MSAVEPARIERTTAEYTQGGFAARGEFAMQREDRFAAQSRLAAQPEDRLAAQGRPATRREDRLAARTGNGAAAQTRMLRIRERLALTSQQDAGLRALLVLAHEALRREDALEQTLAADARWVAAPIAAQGERVTSYAQLVAHVHSVLAGKLPPAARTLVVSRGDEELLATPGLQASHFPQGPNGVYAGHYPADSPAAIAHLERCRADGAEFFVLPATGFWWLDYYDGLLQHLMARGRVVHHDEQCLIFDLRTRQEGAASP